jgi:methylthioribose-1-phosphate isomerase
MKVNGTHYRTIWLSADDPTTVEIIDQRQLPHRFVVVPLRSVEDSFTAIKDMLVRGAGLIGATAGYGMYLTALQADDHSILDEMARAGAYLKSARPTARNLGWAIDRVLAAVAGHDAPEAIRETSLATAVAIADEDAEFCRLIGEHGKALIQEIASSKPADPVNILTHCNAGWLAFVDYGSATAPIYAARDAGIDLHVWVDETRPWNQGSRLTCWELGQEGVNHTLITDNAGGHLMQHGLVDLVLVGSDRTTRTGDVANKIGTYLKALSARDNNIPFYVALPSSTFDWQLAHGTDIEIEIRSGDEITTIAGLAKDGTIESVRLAPDGVEAANYGFDVTPSRLVNGLITERGIVAAEEAAIVELFTDKITDTRSLHVTR